MESRVRDEELNDRVLRDTRAHLAQRAQFTQQMTPLTREHLIDDRRVPAAVGSPRETGLEVDIVTGSSPTSVLVDLPAGQFGRPALTLEEAWVKKGVAVQLLQAVDHKSVTPFGLILAACALFVANAVSAAVRERTRELSVLTSLGWSRLALARMLLAEIALVAGLRH